MKNRDMTEATLAHLVDQVAVILDHHRAMPVDRVHLDEWLIQNLLPRFGVCLVDEDDEPNVEIECDEREGQDQGDRA